MPGSEAAPADNGGKAAEGCAENFADIRLQLKGLRKSLDEQTMAICKLRQSPPAVDAAYVPTATTFRPDVSVNSGDLEGLESDGDDGHGHWHTIRITWDGKPFDAIVRARKSTFMGADGRTHHVIGGRNVCQGADIIGVYVRALTDVTYAVDATGNMNLVDGGSRPVNRKVCDICGICGVPTWRHADVLSKSKSKSKKRRP